MEYLVFSFLALALLLYAIFGGADFGMGMLEALTPKSLQDRVNKVTNHALAPVWEANHMWIILVVVILFVGFPPLYSTISTFLHIPITLLLFGIILRGCAFAFRHYDPDPGRTTTWYSAIFRSASFITPLFMGVSVGTLISGRISLNGATFFASYIHPWLGIFPLSIGVFLCFLCMLLAATFLLGEELDTQLEKLFINRAKQLILAVGLSGTLVFLAAEYEEMRLLTQFFSSFMNFGTVALAAILALVLWQAVSKKMIWISRLCSAGLVCTVLIGWYFALYPKIVIFRDVEALSLYNSIAPATTINSLSWALCIGVILIFPALFYLLYIFKRPNY